MSNKSYYTIRKEKEILDKALLALTDNHNNSISEDCNSIDDGDISEKVFSADDIPESFSGSSHSMSSLFLDEIARNNFSDENIPVFCPASNSCNNEMEQAMHPFNDMENNDSLREELKNWAIEYNVSHDCFRGLLSILCNYHKLPKDPRTILRPKNAVMTPCGKGNLHYIGIHDGGKKQANMFPPGSKLKLDIMIDGFNPIKSKKRCSFWPILGSFSNTFFPPSNKCSPFVIALYYGREKPDIEVYLQDFLKELHEVMSEGMGNYKVELRCIIADAPAKSFLKQVKGSTGYYGCCFCNVRGERNPHTKSTNFNSFNCEIRTDESFRMRVHKKHHTGNSPFEKVNIDMIHSFPCDYMHQVLLGVMKKLLKMWLVEKPFKLSPSQKCVLNDRVDIVKKMTPMEFNRKQRSFEDLPDFKATEFRTILLYSGMFLFKGLLCNEMFEHFKLLYLAMRFLCSPEIDLEKIGIAEKLLFEFVKKYTVVYKNMSCTYNVHNLLHIADDCRRLGPLDTFSAFPFESMLGNLGRRLRSSNAPLSQLARRISEGYCFLKDPVKPIKIVPHKMSDSCVMMPDGRVGLVEEDRGEEFLVRLFQDSRGSSLRNEDVGVVVGKLTCIRILVEKNDTLRKCFIIPCKKNFLISKLL